MAADEQRLWPPKSAGATEERPGMLRNAAGRCRAPVASEERRGTRGAPVAAEERRWLLPPSAGGCEPQRRPAQDRRAGAEDARAPLQRLERKPCIGRSLHILPHERVLSNVPSMEAPIEVCVKVEIPKPYLALHAKPSPPHTGIPLFGVQRHGNGAGLAMAWV